MIGRIQGTLLIKELPVTLIDVHGLGYEIEVPLSTFEQLPDCNEQVTLYTHFIVREDGQRLYGFYTLADRAFFRSIIKVNGIGPKSALAILSSITPTEFAQSIQEKNTSRLVRLPGVGKKTAERLLVEMRDKLSEWYNGASAVKQLPLDQQTAVPSAQRPVEQEALSALIALGYKPPQASRMLNGIDTDGLSVEAVLRKALQQGVPA